MNVKLISYTPDAMSLLLRTKNTRLGFDSDPAEWSAEKRHEHLAYMKDTIKSSWEMVDYTFEISGVSRVFTHQLVRTRTGSYAQESQRTVDVRDNEVLKPQSIRDTFITDANAHTASNEWDIVERRIIDSYKNLIDSGIPVQDARGILPMNMTTSIVAKFNLRTLHEMAKVRLCVRTQGEYQNVFREMRDRVIEVHPWVSEFEFIEVHCVSTGTCAFPRFGKTSCAIYDPAMDLTDVKRAARERFWTAVPQVAVPVAKNGKTM